jgi:hypothetical protein
MATRSPSTSGSEEVSGGGLSRAADLAMRCCGLREVMRRTTAAATSSASCRSLSRTSSIAAGDVRCGGSVNEAAAGHCESDRFDQVNILGKSLLR